MKNLVNKFLNLIVNLLVEQPDTSSDVRVIREIRLSRQMESIYGIIQNEDFYTLQFISAHTMLPERTVAACLRNFRKQRITYLL